jgi:hypothetical protein
LQHVARLGIWEIVIFHWTPTHVIYLSPGNLAVLVSIENSQYSSPHTIRGEGIWTPGHKNVECKECNC